MIYLTGDTHRGFTRVTDFCRRVDTTKEDTLIILGDAGINFVGGVMDKEIKTKLEALPITLFCIHGNHEKRPNTIDTYKEVPYLGGVAYQEESFPSIIFAKDGEVYDFGGKKTLVLGGAYSVDKPYRLARGLGWWEDEQPSPEIKARVGEKLKELDYKVDYVLSHTCPTKYIPKEKYLKGIDQSTVDQSTEDWLCEIESKLTYEKWYCGHWHTSKVVDKLRFMYNDYVEAGK